jgi:hypothetical protein
MTMIITEAEAMIGEGIMIERIGIGVGAGLDLDQGQGLDLSIDQGHVLVHAQKVKGLVVLIWLPLLLRC